MIGQWQYQCNASIGPMWLNALDNLLDIFSLRMKTISPTCRLLCSALFLFYAYIFWHCSTFCLFVVFLCCSMKCSVVTYGVFCRDTGKICARISAVQQSAGTEVSRSVWRRYVLSQEMVQILFPISLTAPPPLIGLLSLSSLFP